MKKFQEFFFQILSYPFRVIRLGWKNGLSSFYIKRRKNRGIHDEWNFFFGNEDRSSGCVSLYMRTFFFVVSIIRQALLLQRRHFQLNWLAYVCGSHMENHRQFYWILPINLIHEIVPVRLRSKYTPFSIRCTHLRSLRLLRPLHLCLTGCL